MEPQQSTPEPTEQSVTPNPEATTPITPAAAVDPSVPAPAVTDASPAIPGFGNPVQPQVTSFSDPQPQMTSVDSGQPPMVGMPASTIMPPVPGSSKKRWLLPAAIVAVLVVVLGGGYTFAFYLPNRPSTVLSTSLKNSGKAVDALVNYGNSVAKKSYKSYGFSGTMNAKTDGVSLDATLSGAFDKDANGSVALNADVLGEKIGANVRSLHVQGNTSPDVYVQLTGIKTALDTYGLNSLDNLDGQWLSVDHTLIDTLTSSLDQGTMADAVSASSVPTTAQIDDAAVKVQVVDKKYLFTTDSSTAVLKDTKYVGKQTKDGRSTYHYKTGYDKAHLQAYAKAVGAALDSSSLNTWSKAANDGQSLSSVIDISDLSDAIGNAKTSYTFDVWVDTKTKLIHTIQFADPSAPSSVFALTQNYTGGDTYPFVLSLSGKDSASGDAETASLALNINTKTDKDSGSLTFNAAGSTGSVKFTVTPSNDAVNVVAPTGAEPVMNILGELGLGSSL